VDLVRKERQTERLKLGAAHLAGEREPVVPPRITDREAEVIFGQKAHVEEIGVEAMAGGSRLDAFADIDAPGENAGPAEPLCDRGGEPRIAHDLAI
jgi:hypothetical protein